MLLFISFAWDYFLNLQKVGHLNICYYEPQIWQSQHLISCQINMEEACVVRLKKYLR